jgi:uncharacterized surface protein with fasciclin (FAS1) repeats
MVASAQKLYFSSTTILQKFHTHKEIAMHRKLIAGLVLALTLLIGSTPLLHAQMADMNIVETAAANEDFSTLVAAVQAAGLADVLAGEGPFTVFAPTNDAFAALPAGTVEALLADPTGDLTQILLYHVIPGKVMAADVTDGLEVETVQGSTVTFTVADGKVMINDAEVVMTDIETSNGVIHVISSVILPPAEGDMAEEAMAEEEMTDEAMAEDAMMGDIVDIASGNGDFSTLVAAVQAAGLVDALKGEGPFTVFAPTNDAFAALPAGTLDTLLADPSGDLTQILLYHVISGKVMAADVTDGLEAETLQGSTVTFSVADGKVMINDAEIIMTDIEASNGVIHVIDAVLLPPTGGAMAAEEMDEEMSDSPATMPTTGGDLGSPSLMILIVALLAAGLVTGTWATRRRVPVRNR